MRLFRKAIRKGNLINPSGEVSGSYVDAGGIGHIVVRTKDGSFIEFDVPVRARARAKVPLAAETTHPVT